MNQGETIQAMQKRLPHIGNQLGSLGKLFPAEDLINKVLRCLNREWKPKVTTIAKSRNLATMTLATLFGKLQEHELELTRLAEHEEKDKKKKILAPKASSSNPLDEDEENMDLMVRKFKKFMRRKNFTIKRLKQGKLLKSTNLLRMWQIRTHEDGVPELTKKTVKV